MIRGKMILLAGATALALVLIAGCSLLPREEAGAALGYSIKLRIQTPATAKGITVGEFDVTGLHIEVLDLAEQSLASIDWTVGEGAKSYDVPVPQPGEYRIVVTHLGGSEEAPVQATEEAAFEIRAMKITVIDIVPGGIGLILVAGQEVPPPFDLTGYWDDTTTWTDGSVTHDIMCLLQTGSTLNFPNGVSIALDGLNFSAQVWIEDFECFITVAGTISEDGSEINGTQSGFPFGGGSATFHMVRSTASFGRLDLEGTCGGAPVSLHTDYGYARRSETISTYTHNMSLHWDTFWGELRLVHTGQLSPGSYPVTNDFPEEPGQIRAVVSYGGTERTANEGYVSITRYDSSGMAGDFSLDFPEGNLSGSFDVTFGVSTGYVSMAGWLSGTTANSLSQMSVWTRTPFRLEYQDQDLNVRLWCDIKGELRAGEFIVPEDVHISLEWFSDSGTYINGWPAWDSPGTMTISTINESDIIGSFAFNFEDGGAVSGSFDLSFLLQ